jgi:osmotically-inducible protein OsmY
MFSFRRSRSSFCIASLLSVALTGCDKNEAPRPRPASPSASPAVASSPPRLDDAQVTSAVLTSLERDPGVDAGGLRVHATDGIVELTGKASDILTKKRAVRVAEGVKGVRAVSDRIAVELKERPDDEIKRDVENALLTDAAADSYEIQSKVTSGKVTLNGKVQSYQERVTAERVAEGVRGVRSVQNEIEVQHGVARSDAEVAADVKSFLRWDTLVNDGLIDVAVHDGHVVLSGQVASASEKRRAALDAWVLGAKQVDAEGLNVTWYAAQRDLMKNKPVAKPDADIAAAIRSAAAYDPRVSAADLRADVKAGVATLSGTVTSPSGKLAAEDLARHTVGVLSVKNELTVRPRKPVSDAVVLTSVKSALLWNPYTNPYPISVKAHEGKVTLTGNVATPYDRAQATNVVSNISGVKDVDNELTVTHAELTYVYSRYLFPYAPYWESWYYVAPNTARSDADIAHDIHDELVWSPFVDADQVKVKVDHGKAILTGQVDSRAERMAATDNAFEGGATVVENDLTIKGG